ncbi:MAG: AAA family ATPase [Bryobacterales bacterium]|nr:AAA family ATPase [Bryobacterales bacterium]
MQLRIRNYRCFADETVRFQPGVNVLLGENNGGKTTVINALRLVLGQRARQRPSFFDFHQPCTDWTAPPSLSITITFRSSDTDKVEDKALVATWLTKLDPPWEAQLTYVFALDPDQQEDWLEPSASRPNPPACPESFDKVARIWRRS